MVKMLINEFDKADKVFRDLNLQGKGKTHCSKCGEPLRATKVVDGGGYFEHFATFVFTCPNSRWWRPHSKEFLNIMGNYVNILRRWTEARLQSVEV